MNYYNEFDPGAAAWLRELINAGHIAPGDVDERSIVDVKADDLRGYTQCHFFCGIAGWPLALRQAGWADDQEVWSGSCPCQPFSSAGSGAGFDDERHLWPHFQRLIAQRKPAACFGEQVASKAADDWIDLVQVDMENMGYAFAAIAYPSASVGAPHIRDRLYWVGDSSGARLEGHAGNGCPAGREGQKRSAAETSVPSGLADADGNGCQPRREGCEALGHWQAAGSDRSPGGMADHLMQQRPDGEPGICLVDDAGGRIESSAAATGLCGDLRPSPTNGFWADADWIFCRDGKWRPVESGTFPLAHGAPSRVGRLRAYGNAINAKAAQAFIECVM